MRRKKVAPERRTQTKREREQAEMRKKRDRRAKEKAAAAAKEPHLTPPLANLLAAVDWMPAAWQIRHFYPGAGDEGELERIFNRLLEEIEASMEADDRAEFRSRFARPQIDQASDELRMPLLYLRVRPLFTACSGWSRGLTTEELSDLRDKHASDLSQAVKDVKERLANLMVFHCLQPDPRAQPDYADPRRALFVFQKYWAFLKVLVVRALKDELAFAPHPAAVLIANLEKRLQSCLSQLESAAGHAEAVKAIHFFVETLLSGDPSELQTVAEHTNEQLAIVETFLQRARLSIGYKEFTLTFAEEYFLSWAEGVANDCVARMDAAIADFMKQWNQQQRQDAQSRAETQPVRTSPDAERAVSETEEAKQAEEPPPADENLKSEGRRKAKRRRRTPRREPRPLTARQMEAAQIVGECKGNIREATARIGRDPKTVKQHYEAAMRKLGKTAVKHKTQALRRDRRGVDDIAPEDDLRC